MLFKKFTYLNLQKYMRNIKMFLLRKYYFFKKTMILLFLLSQIIQFVIIWYLDSDYTVLLVIVSILLSISICFNFLNTIYLTIMQAEAKFYSYSLATTLNSFLVAVFIYPLTLFFNVFGLVLSRLIRNSFFNNCLYNSYE